VDNTPHWYQPNKDYLKYYGVTLGGLLHMTINATVIACCINASGALGSDLDACDASRLVCEKDFTFYGSRTF
jgi:hypothetical protein